MSSWIACKCGYRIGTGAFPNDHVGRIISESQYDEVVDPVDRRKLSVLFLSGSVFISCPQCERVLIGRNGADEIEFFVKEAAPE